MTEKYDPFEKYPEKDAKPQSDLNEYKKTHDTEMDPPHVGSPSTPHTPYPNMSGPMPGEGLPPAPKKDVEYCDPISGGPDWRTDGEKAADARKAERAADGDLSFLDKSDHTANKDALMALTWVVFAAIIVGALIWFFMR